MQTKETKNYTFPIIVIGVLFFIFGFITWANSQLIPYLKIACQLSNTQSYFVTTAFFAAYFVMALPSSWVLERIGFKNGMAVGLFVMAVGAALFIPAALTRAYWLFLVGLFVTGTGMALLQTAVNPYITILGPKESAARRLSLMGLFNKLAGIVSVYALGYIMLKDVDAVNERIASLSGQEQQAALQSMADKIIQPYVIIAIVFVLFSIILSRISLPRVDDSEEAEISAAATSIWTHSNLVLGVIAIFLYVGVEVISYDAFSSLGVALGYSIQEASSFASYTGYGLLVGYLLSIVLIPKYISQRPALIVASIASSILVVIAITSNGIVAVSAFALLGFTQSIMWPAIWPLALSGLGLHTKRASALLVMGIVGGAVLPPFYGYVSHLIGNAQLAYFIMIPAYLFILYYALIGHKPKRPIGPDVRP